MPGMITRAQARDAALAAMAERPNGAIELPAAKSLLWERWLGHFGAATPGAKITKRKAAAKKKGRAKKAVSKGNPRAPVERRLRPVSPAASLRGNRSHCVSSPFVISARWLRGGSRRTRDSVRD
jgi:hypothetical protein